MDLKKLNTESNPLSEKVIEYRGITFKLWLEFEEICDCDDLENDFANIGVDLLDGRHYGINVWTYDFLKTSINNDKKSSWNLNGLYQIPPDLFVKELTRDCIEKVIIDLFLQGDLEDVLNPSIFGLSFLEPYFDSIEMEEESITALLNELKLELPSHHVLYNKNVELIAKKTSTDDIILELENGNIAVVHLTWKSKEEVDNYPITRIYKDERDFWTREMQHDIIDFQRISKT